MCLNHVRDSGENAIDLNENVEKLLPGSQRLGEVGEWIDGRFTNVSSEIKTTENKLLSKGWKKKKA